MMMHHQCYRVVYTFPSREMAVQLGEDLFSRQLIFDIVVYPVTTKSKNKKSSSEEFRVEVLTMRGCVPQVVDLLKEHHPEKNSLVFSRPEYSSTETFNAIKRSVVYPKMNWVVFFLALLPGVLVLAYILARFLIR